MALQHLTDEQVRTWSLEQKDRWWLANVFRGDMPQLTLRSAITGFFLGGILSATNLYIGAKTGWSLGVGITSVILAFGLFKVMQKIGLAKEFTILENNAMQSVATAAGYMTSPLISSLTAYMVVQDRLLPAWQIMSWIFVTALMGVLFAFPMKRRFINDEQHPFPEGRAAGVVMDTLHSSDASVGVFKAKVLLVAGLAAAAVKFAQSEGIQFFLQFRVLRRAPDLLGQLDSLRRQLEGTPRSAAEAFKALKGQIGDVADKMHDKLVYLPEQVHEALHNWFGYTPPKLAGIDVTQLTITPALDLSLIGAGGLMGIRSGVSLIIGATLNYFVLAPWMIHLGDIKAKAGSLATGDAVFGLKAITLWSLWPGIACMVIASFTAFFAKPAVIIGAFRGVVGKRSPGSEVLKHIELPLWISLVGIPILAVISAVMGHFYFGMPIWVPIVGVPLTFVLSLVAANSTALTSTTPVGATAKITQLFYGLVRPGDIYSNIATASMTADAVSNSSNLLMDIKPGYMLGAKPRQQALGHVIGIIAGALAATPLFFILFTHDVDPLTPGSVANIQSAKFPMPSVTVWKGVAEVLTKGLSELPVSAVYAVIVAALVGFSLEVGRIATRGKFPLSPVAMGLAFVIDFQSSLCMFTGALAFWLLGVGRLTPEQSRGNLWVENNEPICAGIIAGAALMGIADAVAAAFLN